MTIPHARLTVTEGGSNKFWELRVEGAQYEIGYGRIGTQGRVETKSFATAAEAQAAAQKVLRSKVAKGYAVVASDGFDKPAGEASPLAPEAKAFAAKGFQECEAMLLNPATYGLELADSSLDAVDLRRILGLKRVDELLRRGTEYEHGKANPDPSISEVKLLKRGETVLAYQVSIFNRGKNDYDSEVDLFLELGVDARGRVFLELWSENGG